MSTPDPIPPTEDPFADGAKTTPFEQYGLAGLSWYAYDLGCGGAARDPSGSVSTWAARLMFIPAKATVAALTGVSQAALEPTYLSAFDPLLSGLTEQLRQAIYTPLFPLAVLLTGLLLMAQATRQRVSRVHHRDRLVPADHRAGGRAVRLAGARRARRRHDHQQGRRHRLHRHHRAGGRARRPGGQPALRPLPLPDVADGRVLRPGQPRRQHARQRPAAGAGAELAGGAAGAHRRRGRSPRPSRSGSRRSPARSRTTTRRRTSASPATAAPRWRRPSWPTSGCC